MASVFITGKVVVDDGSELPEPAAVQTVCHGQKHTESYTDSRGGFSFEIGHTNNISGFSDADAGWNSIAATRARNLQDCDLQGALAGFTSASIPLNSKISQGESNDIGRIVLHRIAQVEGFTISATSAAAPGAARKEFEKGRKEELKSRFDQAQEAFQKAVQIYPRYAVAWCELGRLQQKENDSKAATYSFNQSIAADPQYVTPYRGLAQLSVLTQQWNDLIKITNRMLDLNPINFPDIWFLNALGNYYEKNFENAEKSARRGLHLDAEHQLPKLELLLGVVLLQRHQYGDAAEHLRQFLQLSPTGPESDLARKQLAELQQMDTAKDPTAVAVK